MLFVCYPKCSTCKKAEAWLTEHGAAFQKRDIKEDNPTREELARWLAASGLPGKAVFQHQRPAVQGPGAERPAARHDRGGTAGPAGHRRYAGKAPHPGGRGHRAGGLQRGGMGGARPLKGGGRLRLAGKNRSAAETGEAMPPPFVLSFAPFRRVTRGERPPARLCRASLPPGGGGACVPGAGGGRSRRRGSKRGRASLSPSFFGKVRAQPTGSQTRIWVRPRLAQA